MQQRPTHAAASQAAIAERLAVKPDATPAAFAAAWLLDPTIAPAESANSRIIRRWETEPQAPQEKRD